MRCPVCGRLMYITLIFHRVGGRVAIYQCGTVGVPFTYTLGDKRERHSFTMDHQDRQYGLFPDNTLRRVTLTSGGKVPKTWNFRLHKEVA